MVQTVVSIPSTIATGTVLWLSYIAYDMQEQYAFIHDAVLEMLICGDSQIPASDLRRALDQLRKADKKFDGLTGFEKQFQVIANTS